MFRDTQRELERLEAELLAEEDQEPPREEEDDGILWDEDREEGRPEDEPVIFRNYSNGYGRDIRNYANGYRAYNADRTDVDMDEFSQQVREPKERNTGLMVLAMLLLLGIVAVLAYWVYRYQGL